MRLRRTSCALAAAGVLWCTASSALAQSTGAATPVPPPTNSAPPDDAVTLHGLISSSYSYNFNRPASRTNGFRVFDGAEGFQLNVAELSVEKLTPRSHSLGFRVDLEAGSSIPHVEAAAGLFRDPVTGKARNVDIQQAYVSYAVSHGVRVDVGKFVTPLGLEVIEGWDGYNDNASRSLLFGYAIPFTHAGVRVGYTSRRVSALAVVTNGWDNVKDNNRAKTVAGQLTIVPVDALSVSVTTITGAEQTSDNHDRRTVYDVVATWKMASGTTFGFNADLGHEAHATADGSRGTWRGAAGYLRVGVSRRVSLCIRGEIFDDVNGVRTGVAQRLTELTLTPEWRVLPKALIRADFRLDRSNHPVFEGRAGVAVTRQPTVQINVVVSF